ncbi:wall-associated protein [Paenibacillus algicola]|uniref:Wall-associated protein n=1 Tax=Paenibacillus algicola TaxID=2565926 RepID=A0A4P8XGM0_9BACL|nr:RHS repeat-associated core domain-containing protein [Paenibacillus algicola]QCT01647.1 wall-associated protein [Paenibacillus algicola]
MKHEGTTRQPFAYNGRDGVQIDINGLYTMRARYYNPDIKRFMNRDALRGKVSLGLNMNRFAHVNGNPVTFVDPLGLDAIQAGKSKGTGKEYKKYKFVEYNGTTRVNGEERDISRRVFQRVDIDYKRIDPDTGKTNFQLMKKR